MSKGLDKNVMVKSNREDIELKLNSKEGSQLPKKTLDYEKSDNPQNVGEPTEPKTLATPKSPGRFMESIFLIALLISLTLFATKILFLNFLRLLYMYNSHIHPTELTSFLPL